MSNDVLIETISRGHPDFAFREFVTLVNKSQHAFYLTGWKVLWTEASTGRELHEHKFSGWDREFKPGRKLFLFSGFGNTAFFSIGEHPKCPIMHWQVFTKSNKHICSVPNVKVTLYNSDGIEVDHIYSDQFRSNANKRPAVAIGHGRDNAWRDLKDHLRDQQGFEVEAFETESRASHTIPDVIASLGNKSNMAILVMTGEDATAGGDLHPRLNVVQELGKFQEKFGNNKTIILVEKGVTVPSNNSGIVRLDFESGQIKSTFGDIVALIRREFNLW